MINGARVRQAREFSGLTQASLASMTGLDQSAITRIEAGEFQPSDASLASIAIQTGFPPAFFRAAKSMEFPQGTLAFRSHVNVPSRERQQAYRWAEVVFEAVANMAGKMRRMPQMSIPRLAGSDPAEAARQTRSILGLSPDTPIGNLVHTLEKSGVLIILLPVTFRHIDAFSAWVGDTERRPVIFVANGQPGARFRLTVGHDLGHLVLHHPVYAPERMEGEAFRFAAEFLMPAGAMLQEMVRPVTLTTLAKLKPRWGVSIQALTRRARELNIITSRQYTYLFEQMGAQGWKTNEPIFIPVERPRAVRKIAEVLYGNPIDYRRAATDARLTVRFLRELIESHAMATELPRKNEGQGKVIAMARRLS